MLGLNQENRKFRQLAPTNNNISWEEQIEKIPGVISFGPKMLAYLSSVLDHQSSPDPYLVSPAYHAFTGRYGLWGYAKKGVFLLFARHPNNPDHIIIFPQFGSSYPDLISDLIQNLDLRNFRFSVVRCPAEQADFISASLNRRSKDLNFKPEAETVLDWTYPVHTLSTRNVLEAKGKSFKSFRYDLNKINEEDITAKLINPHTDIPELKYVVDLWAANKNLIDTKETVNSYLYLLRLMQSPSLRLSGLKFYKNDIIVAFEIWSLPPNNNGVACNLAGLNIQAVENLQGFSSYQYYSVCKSLHEQGIKYVCIGGSETEGLDYFKRKMSPVHSLNLSTIQIYNHAMVSKESA